MDVDEYIERRFRSERYIQMRKYLLIVTLLSTLAGSARAQSWSNILSASRAIDWTQAGLPATLPDGETTANPWTPPVRTQCGSTLMPSGNPTTDTAAITSAYNACTAGHYVLLGPGAFGVSSYILLNNDGVSLRGSGPQSTTLNLAGSNVFITVGEGSGGGQCTWSSGFSAGSTTLGLTGCFGSPSAPIVGTVLFLSQCDSGFSGASCATGATVDNGGLYICGNVTACIRASEGTGPPNQQTQNVLVTGVTSLGGGAYTVTISPGIYMPNWSSSNTPLANFQVTYYGIGLEDLTMYTDPTLDSSTAAMVYFDDSYGSWVKGVRWIGAAQNTDIILSALKNCLFMNNYLHSRVTLDAAYPVGMQEAADSDTLILNNIMDSSVGYEGIGSNEGVVYAYNFPIWSLTNQETTNTMEHEAGNAFRLYEGNLSGAFVEDDTHGTHDLSTWFRNYATGYYQNYTTNPNKLIFDLGEGDRFTNFVGNVLGSSYITTYQLYNPGGGGVFNYLYGFDTNPTVIYDPLVQATSFRWANYDTITGATRYCGPGASGFTSAPCSSTSASSLSASESSTTVTVTSTLNPSQWATVLVTACSVSGYDGAFLVSSSSNSTSFQYVLYATGLGAATGCTATLSSEVPTVLAGNASALNSFVPSTTSLPCSFFLQGYTATTCTPLPSGGTGLNWWKVCTAWTTFPTACSATSTTPFPPIGPDVTGGSTPLGNFGAPTSVGGHAYDIPASIAFAYLPIDTSYQSSYTVSSSSWSGGVETLNFGTPFASVTHIIGGLQISGSACATSGAGTPTGAEVFITTSTTTSVEYALASNPGSCAGGAMLFPDVRQFDERVYENDPAGNVGATPTFSPVGGMYVGTQSVTISVTGSAPVICYTTNGATPATNGTSGCTTGTLYTTAISVSASETVKAINGGTGYFDGAVGSATYTINATGATPTFSPVAGTYTGTQSVTISVTGSAPVICYTVNGSTPVTNGTSGCTTGTLYTTAISVASSETVKAINGGTGYVDGSVGSAAYVINGTGALPTFSPVAGTYTGAQSVTISVSGSAPVICYTVNGATPATNGTSGCTTGTLYSTAISVAASETVKAINGGTGYSDGSVASAAYIINSSSSTPAPATGFFVSVP